MVHVSGPEDTLFFRILSLNAWDSFVYLTSDYCLLRKWSAVSYELFSAWWFYCFCLTSEVSVILSYLSAFSSYWTAAFLSTTLYFMTLQPFPPIEFPRSHPILFLVLPISFWISIPRESTHSIIPIQWIWVRGFVSHCELWMREGDNLLNWQSLNEVFLSFTWFLLFTHCVFRPTSTMFRQWFNHGNLKRFVHSILLPSPSFSLILVYLHPFTLFVIPLHVLLFFFFLLFLFMKSLGQPV